MQSNYMSPYEILTIPNPILKQLSIDVAEVNDEVRSCLDRLLVTLHHNNGIGISAIQVGIAHNIIVIDIDGVYMRDDPNFTPVHEGKPLYMINAQIVDKSPQLASFNEGCLSVPSVYFSVERPETVTVKFLDYYGKEKIMHTNNHLLAVCILHEYDHTRGITILDYMSTLKRELQIKKVEKYKKNLNRSSNR